MDELSKTLCSSSYAKDNGVLLYNNDVEQFNFFNCGKTIVAFVTLAAAAY